MTQMLFTYRFSKLNNKRANQFIYKSLFIGLLCWSSGILAEQPPLDTGPAIGSHLPALTVRDQFGDKQQLANVMGEKGSIIVLFRSADWCPFCKRHLLELNSVVKDFRKLGYGVIGISYDSPKILRKFSQKKKLSFALLSDQKVATFSAFDVVNPEHSPGHRHYGIPYPGVIVVDSNGMVKHKYFFEGYKKRVKFKQLFKKLKQASKTSD